MSRDLILVVCSANVCRSPYAALLLRRGLAERDDIEIASAGTHAHDGEPMCALVAGRMTDRAGRLASGSRTLTADLLEQATLVLTASKDVRADVVKLSPLARDRTFTMVEAAHRGSGFALSDHQDGGSLSDYVEHLDRARATLGAVPVRAHRWGRHSDDGISIEDRHGSRDRLHNKTLDEVEAAVGAIATQLGGIRVRV